MLQDVFRCKAAGARPAPHAQPCPEAGRSRQRGCGQEQAEGVQAGAGRGGAGVRLLGGDKRTAGSAALLPALGAAARSNEVATEELGCPAPAPGAAHTSCPGQRPRGSWWRGNCPLQFHRRVGKRLRSDRVLLRYKPQGLTRTFLKAGPRAPCSIFPVCKGQRLLRKSEFVNPLFALLSAAGGFPARHGGSAEKST